MTHSAMDRDKPRPSGRTPDVLKKLKPENLLAIERGLLGEIPEKLRPTFVPVRGLSNNLQVAKPSGLLSSCLPVLPDSPISEKLGKSPWDDDDNISPLIKKSFSFRDKFSKMGFFKDKEKDRTRYKTIDEDEKNLNPKIKASPKLERRTAKAEHDYKSNKRFWFRRNKEMGEIKKYLPIYQRSKSFEFLPRAIAEYEAENNKNPLSNRNSFNFGSNDSIGDTWSSNESLEYVANVYGEGGHNKSNKKNHASESPNENSSLSTVNSNSSGAAASIFKRESVQDLLEEFEKTVHMFSENYVSDSEVYAKTKKVSLKEKHKSASFGSFPSPKVMQVSTVSKNNDVFKQELSKVLNANLQNAVRPPASPRRGSVTDWFILEDHPSNALKSAAIEQNKYKRAQNKPVTRVRRISSTKYETVLSAWEARMKPQAAV